jgi:hypothetical protein
MVSRRTTPEIRARIAELEARLIQLERDRSKVRAELDTLRCKAVAVTLRVPSCSAPAGSTTPTTPSPRSRWAEPREYQRYKVLIAPHVIGSTAVTVSPTTQMLSALMQPEDGVHHV